MGFRGFWGSIIYGSCEKEKRYIKTIIRNFRNFKEENNEIEFVNSTEIKKEDKTNVAAVTTLIVGKNNA